MLLKNILTLKLIFSFFFYINAQSNIDYKLSSDPTYNNSNEFGLLNVIDVDSDTYLSIICNYGPEKKLPREITIASQELQIISKEDHKIKKIILLEDLRIIDAKFINEKFYLFGRSKNNSFLANEFDLVNYRITDTITLIDGNIPNNAQIPELIITPLLPTTQRPKLSLRIYSSKDNSKIAVVQKEIVENRTGLFRVKVFDNNFKLLREDEIIGKKKTNWLAIKSAVLNNDGQFFAQFEFIKNGRETIVTKDDIFGDNNHAIRQKVFGYNSHYYNLSCQNDTLFYYSSTFSNTEKKVVFKKTLLDENLKILEERIIFKDDNNSIRGWDKMRGIEKLKNGNTILISEVVRMPFDKDSSPSFEDIYITVVDKSENIIKSIIIEKQQFCEFDKGSFSYALKDNLLSLAYNNIKKGTNEIKLCTINLETGLPYKQKTYNFDEIGCTPDKNNFFPIDDSLMVWYMCNSRQNIQIKIKE